MSISDHAVALISRALLSSETTPDGVSAQGGWQSTGTNAGKGRQRGPRRLAERAGEAGGVVHAHGGCAGGCAGGCCGGSQEADCGDESLNLDCREWCRVNDLYVVYANAWGTGCLLTVNT